VTSLTGYLRLLGDAESERELLELSHQHADDLIPREREDDYCPVVALFQPPNPYGDAA
jgi:hypothetical protein